MIVAYLEKMKAKNAQAVAEGRIFKTFDEQVTESVADERARQERLKANKRPVGRPRKHPPSSSSKAKQEDFSEEAKVFKKPLPERKYNTWTDEDKAICLDAMTKCKGMRAQAVHHLRNHPQYKGRFEGKNLSEGHLRAFERSARRRMNGLDTKRGRRSLLLPETLESIKKALEEMVESKSHMVGSNSLRPIIIVIIHENGQGDVLEDGRLTISKTWINRLCQKLGYYDEGGNKGQQKPTTRLGGSGSEDGPQVGFLCLDVQTGPRGCLQL